MNNFYNIEGTKEKISEMIDNNILSIVDGGLLSDFENKAAQLFGHQYGIATCNGTTAIHLAYFAINIIKGDEVILPTYGFHAMVSPLLQLGGKPVFCDIEKDTLTISIKDLKRKISEKTKAIMVLQPWGNVADIDALKLIALNNNLILISDSSHAHGALWGGYPLGKYYDIVCASFGKGKLISGGELGILTTNDEKFRDRALLYSHTNRVPETYLTDKLKNISNIIGIKYRPHALALQIALDQMNNFEFRYKKLLNNILKLIDVISEIDGIKMPLSYNKATICYWKIIIICSSNLAERIRNSYKKFNIIIEKNHYHPLIHQDSIITDYYNIHQSNFPIAEIFADTLFQIDAIQLYDEGVLSRYIVYFKMLKED
jgi:dTDP-4-amino-4,6-dideoxygalactose transaminase